MPYAKRTNVGREEFLAAIPDSHGTLLKIEEKLNCTRQALRDCMKKYPELKNELQDEVERNLDRIIIATMQDCVDGDDRVKCKSRDQILKALAKERGFGDVKETPETEGKIQIFLHTSNARLSVDQWSRQAAVFAEQREREVEKQMKELGLS